MKLQSGCVILLAFFVVNQNFVCCFDLNSLELVLTGIVTNIGHLLKAFKEISGALKSKPAIYSLNTSFHDDLAESCRQLRSVQVDYNFFKTTGVCPNLTNVLIEVEGTAKMASDVLVEGTVMGYVLSQDVMGCDHLTGSAKNLCYLDILPSVIKDTRMFISTAQLFLEGVKTMAKDIQKNADFCFQDFDKLPDNQKNAIVKQWTDNFLQKSESCDQLVNDIMSGSNSSTGSGPSNVQTTTIRSGGKTSSGPSISNSTTHSSIKTNTTDNPRRETTTPPPRSRTNSSILNRINSIYNRYHDIIDRIPKS